MTLIDGLLEFFYNKVRIFMKARMEQLLLHLANHIILRY